MHSDDIEIVDYHATRSHESVSLQIALSLSKTAGDIAVFLFSQSLLILLTGRPLVIAPSIKLLNFFGQCM